jgi:hypothetical protein
MSVLRISQVMALLAGLLVVWGCGRSGSSPPGASIAKRAFTMPETWRRTEQERCHALGLARPSPFLMQRASLGGPGSCSVAQPFEMAGALGGQVTLRPSALLRCEMIPAVDKWMAEVVQSGARRHFGQRVVEIKVAASYACRTRNGIAGAKISEHAHANALDVSAFQLADGHWVTVKQGWWGSPRERAFLRDMHAGACETFTTVLGPYADVYHRDHLHFDLAWHGKDGRTRVCK